MHYRPTRNSQHVTISVPAEIFEHLVRTRKNLASDLLNTHTIAFHSHQFALQKLKEAFIHVMYKKVGLLEEEQVEV